MTTATTDAPPTGTTATAPRLRLPGLIPFEPGRETYWVRPGGVTAVKLDPGDRLTVVDREIGRAHV